MIKHCMHSARVSIASQMYLNNAACVQGQVHAYPAQAPENCTSAPAPFRKGRPHLARARLGLPAALQVQQQGQRRGQLQGRPQGQQPQCLALCHNHSGFIMRRGTSSTALQDMNGWPIHQEWAGINMVSSRKQQLTGLVPAAMLLDPAGEAALSGAAARSAMGTAPGHWQAQ